MIDDVVNNAVLLRCPNSEMVGEGAIKLLPSADVEEAGR